MEDLQECKEQRCFSSEETTFEFWQNALTVVWFWLHIKMETQKIGNLLGDADDFSKFVTKKCYVIND